MTDLTEESPPTEPGRSDIWIKVGGLIVACWGAVLLAAVGAFLTPFRIGSVLVPISLLLCVVGLLGLTQFAYDVSGHPWLSLIPGGIWLVISFAWSARTNEGDLVLVGQNWVATVYLFAGAITIGVAAYRMIVPRHRGVDRRLTWRRRG
jgi:hypothetical protein